MMYRGDMDNTSILHLIVVELRASERFRPPVLLPVKLVSVLVLPNSVSCSSVSFRYHWISVTVSLVRVVARHTNAAEPSGKAMDTGGTHQYCIIKLICNMIAGPIVISAVSEGAGYKNIEIP